MADATTIQELLDKADQSSSLSRMEKLITAQYGDGYRQTATFGINAQRSTWNINLFGLSVNERNLFWNTFDVIGQHDVINWQAPNDTNVTKWPISSNPNESNLGTTFSLTFTLEQEHRI